MPTPVRPGPVAEKTEFHVELTAAGANKINQIKVVREITGLGLRAKATCRGRPEDRQGEVVTPRPREKKKLTEAGATVDPGQVTGIAPVPSRSPGDANDRTAVPGDAHCPAQKQWRKRGLASKNVR